MAENERIFDYEQLAKKCNVKSDILNKLVEEASREFPNDQMMIELHIIRAIRALKNNKITH